MGHEVAQRGASLLSWGVGGEPCSFGGDWLWVILGEKGLDVRVRASIVLMEK